jgi:hypothetical protein
MKTMDSGKRPPPNYIVIVNAVWQEMPFIEGYKGQHATVFLAIVDSINRNKWNPVSLPLDYILTKIGFCRKVYTDSRKWLEDNNILKVFPGKNANQMARFELGPAVHIWTSTWTGRDTSTDTPTPVLPVHKRTSTDTHSKTVNNNIDKQETIKAFDEWWNLYDKKINKQDCLKVWNKLTDEERQLLNIHTKKYIQAKADKQYRLNPYNYLNKKAFNDEIVVPFAKRNNHLTTQINTNEDREPL